MSIKIALLKSNEEVICDMKEVLSGDRLVSYCFTKPYVVTITDKLRGKEKSYKLSFTPWIILSEDTEFYINPDWVVSIYNPVNEVEESYLENVNGRS
jgi:hypothetical protein